MNTMSIAFTHLAASERNASDLEGPGGIIAEGLSSDEMNDILIPG